MIVLDTNVVSELAGPEPDPRVVSWTAELEDEEVYITSTTLSELVEGVMRLPEGRRRNDIDERVSRAVAAFYDRTLDFSADDAIVYGRFVPDRDAEAGNPISRADAQIASCCLAAGAVLATRNVKDFEGIPGLEVINPWELEPQGTG
jgi:predicted nucleic acid-binding protein